MLDLQQRSSTVPQALGRYELLTPVARGGMGQVWAGRLRGARGFNKLVAIKTLLPLPGSEGRLESMLLEEARIAALVHHPNVVLTHELGEQDGALYLVMEWVDGEPLSFVLNRADERQGLPLAVAINLIGQTLLGLHAAHELTDDAGKPLGVVHRDVSPHNVLITYSGVAKLVDFGIAKATNQQSSVTDAGEVKGKFSYMAPEQINSGEVDRRADLFAVGIILYMLTTGRHPFHSETPAGVLHKISGDNPAAEPSTLIPDYSPALAAVVLKALAKDRDLRFATAEEMRGALQAAYPEAFAPGIEILVRQSLQELLGDRAALRREVLRRAQLIADTRAGSGAHAGLIPGTSQSASSLRALSIDNAPLPGVELEPPSSPSGRMTLPAPVKKSSRGPILAAIIGGVLLACGAFFFKSGGLPRPPANASSPASAEMVELPAAGLAAAAKSLPPPQEPTAARAGTEAAVPASAPTAAAVASASASLAASASRPPPPPPTKKARAPRSRNRDLIAPDYAR